MFQGNPTRADEREQKRKEKQDELGVCRIRREEENQSSETLGSGFVVKDLPIVQAINCQYCLISSNKVFPNDFNIKSYYLDFKKLNKQELKTIKLEYIASSTKINRTLFPGLVVIPIHPSSKCSKKESIFTYRPFKVVNEGRRPNQDLRCHFIDDQQPIFSVKRPTLRQSETNPVQYQLVETLEIDHYTTYDEVTHKGDRKPYGGAILKYVDSEYVVVGAMAFTDDDRRGISPVFFCHSSGEEQYVPDPANADEVVNPNPSNEAARYEDTVPGLEHLNQERNGAVDGKIESPNLEATVSATAATPKESLQPDEANLERLTINSTQEEVENTVDAGATETAQQPPAANSYDHHFGEEQYVPDPANADEVVNPNPSNEAARYEDTVPGLEHLNQERNGAVDGKIETPNLEATVSAAAATPKESLQPDEANLERLTINSTQEEVENTVDAGATETAQQPPAANSYDHHFVSDLEKYSIQEKLAPYLDHTSHRVIKTWEHLACTKEVNAPLETRLRCRLNNQHSQTQMLIDFIAVDPEMTQKTVKDLIAALKAIGRKDVVEIITAKYLENSTKTVSDFKSSESEMIDKMATKLDQQSRITGNWRNLGGQFKVPDEKLKEIEYGPFNPALVLMEYLYSRQKDLTVKKFYVLVDNKLERGDVLKKLKPFLDEDGEEPMEKVIALESDVMRSLCVDLNSPNRVLKNWRHLASAFNVPRTIYKDFNPEKPLSPTKLLFEWIFANRRDLTVGQLCTALKSIERNDVVRELRKYLEEQYAGQE